MLPAPAPELNLLVRSSYVAHVRIEEDDVRRCRTRPDDGLFVFPRSACQQQKTLYKTHGSRSDSLSNAEIYIQSLDM